MLFSLSKEWNIGQSLQSLTNLSQLTVQMTVSLTKLIYFSLPLFMVNSARTAIITEVSITVIRCYLIFFFFLLNEPQQQKLDLNEEFAFITGVELEVQTADSNVFKANDLP